MCQTAFKDFPFGVRCGSRGRATTCAQTRMRRLEGVRLEVDSRRRTVVDLRHSIDAKRSKPQTPKLEFQTEQLIKKMQHKENKLASTCTCPFKPHLKPCLELQVPGRAGPCLSYLTKGCLACGTPGSCWVELQQHCRPAFGYGVFCQSETVAVLCWNVQCVADEGCAWQVPSSHMQSRSPWSTSNWHS